MKISLRKRIIAFMLSVILLFSGSISSFASELLESDPMAEAAAAVVSEEATEPATEAATEATESSAAIISEEITEATEAVTEEVTEAATEAVTEEATEAAAKEETVEETEEEIVEETETETVEETEESEEETEEETEEIVQVLEYEDNDVKIHVEAVGADAIPEGASLKVSPITSGDAQYNEVEKQLNEKAEGEEYEIAGFLAYDITFVDKDGNKVEPNGNVRVTIDYKKATLPEEVNTDDYDELDVTVMHFEENANGEVKEVVDMVAATNIDAQVTTTDDAEVKKAEFVTDSFSVYTVTWTYSGHTVSLKMHYGYLNNSGEFVEFTEPPTKILENITATQDNTTVNLTEYNNKDVFEIGDYTYDKAYIVKGDAAYSNAISTSQLRLHYSNTIKGVRLQYGSNNNYTELFNVTSATAESDKICSIYYVYKAPPQPIATVDSKADHINIRVIDYSIWPANEKTWDHTVKYDINNGHALKFVTTGTELSGKSEDYNIYTNGSTPRQGFVNKNLSSGYPKLKQAGDSLSYLFTGGYDANYLFKKDNGYYVYDSDQNFASLDTTTGNFRVYSEKNAGFFPFNEFTEELKIESASKTTVENHHSGVYVDFTFMQPKGGKTGGNDMIFEFSGDDDVWVYIDGILVLDLGGIHQPTGGTINFATGDVTYTHATNTTIYKAYVDALKEQGLKNNEAEAKAKTYFVEYEPGKYRFKDYSQHDLDFFYLERGAHDSNCKIKFNLVSIPANAVMIEKKITESNMADFADAEFKFKIEKKDVNSDGTYPETSTILANTSFKLYEVDSAGNRKLIGTRTTNENGEFILKHRQVAEFSGILASTKYCVTEIGVTSEVYDNVIVEGADITIGNSETIGNLTKHDYVTGDLLAQEHVYVTFQNHCNAENLKNLVITKEMASGQTSDDNFDIKLEFADGDKWIPYVGDYYLETSTGDKMSTTNGIITLKAGQQAYVIGLISGTEYRVTEVLSETQKASYGEPTYSGTGTVSTVNDVTYITDTIELKESVSYMAIVTNSLLMTVNANKVWVDSETTHESVYVGLYKQDGERWVPQADDSYRELTEGAWSTSFISLNGGVYDVKELVPVTGEDATGDFVIDGTPYIATNNDYSNGSYNYSVSYSKTTNLNVTNVTITNTRLGKITIEKVSQSDHNLKLPEAEFKIQKLDEANNTYVDIEKTGITDTNGKLTFDDLESGKYQIIETKAPAGYSLSDKEVIVEVGTSGKYEVIVTIENEALYALPSSGGFGIYWYMVAGVAMMILATAIQYKNRRKEVLERVDKR